MGIFIYVTMYVMTPNTHALMIRFIAIRASGTYSGPKSIFVHVRQMLHWYGPGLLHD